MSATVSGYARHNIPRYYTYSALWNTGLWFGVWIKYLTVTRGFELRWVLLMDLPFWLVLSSLEAPLGAAGDRFGRRWMMAGGQALYALTILGFGFVQSYWMLFADYMLWAVSNAMVNGVDQALVYDSLRAERREGEFGRVAGRGFTSTSVAGFVGVLVGGFVAEGTSLAFVVRVSALFPLAAMLVAMTMREPPRQKSDRHYLHDLRYGFVYSWQHRQVRWAVALGSVLMTAAFAPVVLVQPFLIHHDIATGLFGVFQAPLRIAGVVAALVAYRLAARTASVFMACCAALVVAFAVLGAVDATPVFVLFAVPAITQGMLKPTFDTYINHRIPSARRATILSIWSLSFGLQVAIFEPALGFITDGASVAAACLFAAVWFAVLLPPLYTLWLRADRGEPQAELEAQAPGASAAAPGA